MTINIPLVEGAGIAAGWYQSRLGWMRRGQKIALGVVLLVIGVFVAWNLILFPTYAYRYRMTVNIESGGIRYSGASVIEVRLKRQPQFLLGIPRVLPEVSGEAVFVDLGGGRNLIALLAQWQDTDYPKHLIDKHFRLSYADEDLAKFPRLKERWQLANDELPTFLTFTDINDAASARVVPAGDLAQELGEGTRLLDVIVETTKAPVTVGIEKKLPWWNKPFPWEKPLGGGVSFDARRDGLRWNKFMLKRD